MVKYNPKGMPNSDSDFIGSINSDMMIANDFIQSEICRDIMERDRYEILEIGSSIEAQSDGIGEKRENRSVQYRRNFMKNESCCCFDKTLKSSDFKEHGKYSMQKNYKLHKDKHNRILDQNKISLHKNKNNKNIEFNRKICCKIGYNESEVSKSFDCNKHQHCRRMQSDQCLQKNNTSDDIIKKNQRSVKRINADKNYTKNRINDKPMSRQENKEIYRNSSDTLNSNYISRDNKLKDNVFIDKESMCYPLENQPSKRAKLSKHHNNSSFEKSERRNSACLIFSSEMSEDGLRDIVKNSFDKKIEFLSISKKKSFNLFEDSFFFSSEDNLSFDKKLSTGKRSIKSVVSQIQSLENNERILMEKPFQTHWAFTKKNMLRMYSVPETRCSNDSVHRKHLIDFWKNVEYEIQYSLPVLGTGSSDSLMRISVDTVSSLLDSDSLVKYSIIDCRFEYEFQGGHIRNAVNINTTDQMDYFYRNRNTQAMIFHCEYSSIRAPRLANYLRNMDRNKNVYPNLKFPEIYIMEGGYKKFYEIHQVQCTPMHYVSMDDVIERGSSKNTHLQ